MTLSDLILNRDFTASEVVALLEDDDILSELNDTDIDRLADIVDYLSQRR